MVKTDFIHNLSVSPGVGREAGAKINTMLSYQLPMLMFFDALLPGLPFMLPQFTEAVVLM